MFSSPLNADPRHDNDADASGQDGAPAYKRHLRASNLPPVAVEGREPLRGQLARNLRLCRIERDMSQADLAQATGLSRALINRIESGRFAVSLDALEHLAEALQIEPTMLIGPLRLTRPRYDLRELRESRGLSQSSLSAVSGVSRCSINRIENGKAVAGPRAKRAIAEALGVHPATIK